MCDKYFKELADEWKYTGGYTIYMLEPYHFIEGIEHLQILYPQGTNDLWISSNDYTVIHILSVEGKQPFLKAGITENKKSEV